MSLTDYSDLEQEIMDTPEMITLPRGTEVKARIISHQEGEGDYGVWHRLTIDFPSEPLARPVSIFLSDPMSVQDAEPAIKQATFRKFKYFTFCFGINLSRPFDWDDDTYGKEGWVILGVKKSEEFGDQNTVQKFVAGK